MRLPEFDGLLGRVVVRRPLVELWYNGQKVWWGHVGSAIPTVADGVGLAINYCLRWSGSLPEICFEE